MLTGQSEIANQLDYLIKSPRSLSVSILRRHSPRQRTNQIVESPRSLSACILTNNSQCSSFQQPRHYQYPKEKNHIHIATAQWCFRFCCIRIFKSLNSNQLDYTLRSELITCSKTIGEESEAYSVVSSAYRLKDVLDTK